MKKEILFSYMLFITILFCSCGNSETEESYTNKDSEIDTLTISVDTIYQKGVIFTQLNCAVEVEIPVFETPECTKEKCKLKLVSHFNKNPEFYLINEEKEMVLPNYGDFFRFFVKNERKTALVFFDETPNAFQVLERSFPDQKSWIRKSDIPVQFLASTWGAFFDELDYEGLSINTVDRTIQLYSDTSFHENLGRIDDGIHQYALITSHEGTFFKLKSQEVDERSFGGEYGAPLTSLKNEQLTGWTNVIENGFPLIQLTQTPQRYQNYYHGVGHLKGPANDYNIFHNKPRTPYEDSVILYDKPKGKRIGIIPTFKDEFYLYEAQLDTDTGLYQHPGIGYDVNSGLISWDYVRVYEKKKNWVRILTSKMGGKTCWINLDMLSSSVYKYYNWIDYFKEFKNGNAGWEKGYAWCGDRDYLYTNPDYTADKILEFPMNVSIFLLGPTQEEWALVKVKEVEFVFGNEDTDGNYTGEDNVFKEWEGWIRLTNKSGYPNLDEIILGC